MKVPDTLGVAMLVLSLYLGLSPVYSISGVAGAELRLFKSAVIVAGVALVMIPSLIQRRLWLPTGALGPLAFLGLVILSVPGMVQSGDEALAFTFVADIAYGAVFAWCFFHLAREGLDVNIMLVRALVLLAALAAVSVAVAVSSVPDLMSLCEWDEPVHSIFGAHYTAWSMSLALFLPIAALLPSVIRSTAGTSGTLIGIVLAIILLGAQFISGGRAGIAASVLSVAALTLFRTSRIFALAVAAFILMAGVTLFDEQCSKHFRLERISALFAAGEGTPQTLNTLGTGRIRGLPDSDERHFGASTARPWTWSVCGRGRTSALCGNSQPLAQVGGVLRSAGSAVVCRYGRRDGLQRASPSRGAQASTREARDYGCFAARPGMRDFRLACAAFGAHRVVSVHGSVVGRGRNSGRTILQGIRLWHLPRWAKSGMAPRDSQETEPRSGMVFWRANASRW